MIESGLPAELWTEAFMYVIEVDNMTPCKYSHAPFNTINNMNPHEALYKTKPDYTRLKPWGCRAFAHIPTEVREGKFDLKAELCAFVGYARNKKAFRLYSLATRTVVERRSVQFNEKMRVDGTPFPGLEGLSDDEGMVLKLDDNGNITEVSFEELKNTPHRIQLEQMGHPTIVTTTELQHTRAKPNKRKSIAPATVTSTKRKQQRQAKDRRLQDLLAEADAVYSQATNNISTSTNLHESGGDKEPSDVVMTEKDGDGLNIGNQNPQVDPRAEINTMEEQPLEYTTDEDDDQQFIDPALYESEEEETKQEEPVTHGLVEVG